MRKVVFGLSVLLVALATAVIYVAGFKLGVLQIPLEPKPSIENPEPKNMNFKIIVVNQLHKAAASTK